MENANKRSKKIRKGDTVVAIAGNYRGQTGKVLSCSQDKVLVQGINLRKKHVKASQANPKGAIIDMEKPINVSNLKVITDDNKGVKLKVKIKHNGERELFYRLDGKDVVHRSLKKS